jgi:integrase
LSATHGEVRGLKEKKSVDDDRYRLRRHVYPFIGHLPVADVTEIDVERALAKAAQKAEVKLGRPWRQATKFQVYEVMRRLFDLSIKPGHLRADNPVSSDLRPGKDAPKLFCFLYPNELVALLGCTAIPLARRMHYALAAYTGLRKGSLAELRWGSLDFEHGTITSLKSKTGLPQIFAQADPAIPGLKSLMVVLKRWQELQGCPEAHELIVRDHGCKPRREATTLRADLKDAGITRELLFSTAVNVEPLRFHDMRAGFVTWARRAGKGRGWIADRTGHLTDDMMNRYDRQARTLADLDYTPFPDIATAVPELANDLANVTRLNARRQGEAG